MERERDLQLVAELYLRGKMQSEIMNTLNDSYRKEAETTGKRDYFQITQPSISRDLAEVRRRWRESSIRDFDSARAQELAKIDELEREYWKAWSRSIGESKMTRKRKGIVGEGVVDEETTETRLLVGSPKFLEGVERCIAKRCELLGLDAPKKINLVDDRTPATMRDADLKKELMEIIKRESIDFARTN